MVQFLQRWTKEFRPLISFLSLSPVESQNCGITTSKTSGVTLKTEPMIFVLDNYDSFTYNLVQYMGEMGAEMTIRRNDELSVDEVEALDPERILLSPGPCTPQEAGISIELVQRFAGKVPILGVCLGHQAIGAAFGGDVVRAAKLMHGKTSEVEHDGKTIFAGVASPTTCTRYHSLIVSEKNLPAELEVSARTADGTIMGLRHRNYPVEGVQFHPESVLTNDGKQLIRNFLEL
jgi:anthranilate synthase/aminodeoxychorismate synthase-like glutamine amidotransferase